MRGRSLEERAMEDPAVGGSVRRLHDQDIIAIPDRHKSLAAWFAEMIAARTGVRADNTASEQTSGPDLFFFFWLLLGRRKPFETFEQFFLGHPLDRDLGIVGVDRAPRRAD